MALRSVQLARRGLLAFARTQTAPGVSVATCGSRLFSAAAEGGGGGGFGKVLFGVAALVGGAYAADQAGYIDIFSNPAVKDTLQAGTKLLEPKKDYAAVRAAIEKVIESNPDYEDGSYGPVLVRLAWHASGTYDKATDTGGSDGATMRFAPESDHGANAGLKLARELLDPIKKQYPWISYADLWTLAGAQAIETMGGPHIPWRPGRSDKEGSEHCPPDGRLPDATQGASHVRDIFYRMGFNDQEIVALSGAHTLGRCHTDRSGFLGPWTNAPTTFSNLYFDELVNNKWRKKRWSGPVQYEDKSGQLMMLPTDMALVWDKKFKPHVLAYAKDEEAFFKDFASAFSRLLELGCKNLAPAAV